MKTFLLSCIIVTCSIPAIAQQSPDSSLNGKWILKRWEIGGRLIDFDDTTFTMNYMMNQYKVTKGVKTVPAADSIKMREDYLRLLPEVERMRIDLAFNPDHSFSWKGGLNDPDKLITGNYILKTETKEIILKTLNAEAQKDDEMVLSILELAPGKLVIKIPAENQQVRDSKWTFRKL